MMHWSEKRLRIVSWAIGLVHFGAIAAGFTAGRRLQNEATLLSESRAAWDFIHELGWLVAVSSAGIAAAWWIYSAVRRRPWSVLYALFWIIWFALLGLMVSIAPAFSFRMIG